MIWYIVVGILFVLFTVFVLKGYIKKLSRGCCGTGDGDHVEKVRVKNRKKKTILILQCCW